MYALDILNQFQNFNGVPLSHGKMYVYYIGRTRLADIFYDVNGQTPLPNPVDLDNLGMAQVYLSNAYDYTVVICDAYDTEMFSRDIYTNPIGEGGANARLYEGWDPIVVNNDVNVISAKMATFGVESPLYFAEDSESATIIGISGELGKTYSGIDPIVVNNELNKISANTKTLSAETPLYITDYEDKTVISVQSAVLGVQEPLFFVENSETATVIGIQGSAVIPSGTMNESAFGYEDGKITGYNGSGFSAGLNYSGVEPIVVNNEEGKISVNTIGIVGMSPIEIVEYQDVLVVSANLSSYANNSALSSKLDTSSFSSVSGDFLTAIPDEYATKDYVISSVSSKLDVSSFSSVSGDFLTTADSANFATTGDLNDLVTSISETYQTTAGMTAYQSAGDYLTTADSANFYTTANESGFITSLPDTEEVQFEELAVSALVTSGDITGTAQYGLTTAGWTTIAGGNPEVEALVTANSATWNNVTGKLDASASANFELVNSVSKTYSAIMPIDTKYITEVQPAIIRLRNENVGGETEQYTQITQNNLKISGDYNQGNYVNLDGEGLTISSHNSGFAELNSERYSAWNEVSSKLDTTAFSNVSGTFLTAHQDLSDYQTTAGMTAYQPAGDYYSASNPSGFITGLPEEEEVDFEEIDLTDYQPVSSMTAYQPIGDYYSASNPSGFITGVPAGTMNESSFSYDASNNITAYNGSALAGGGSVTGNYVENSALDSATAHSASGTTIPLATGISSISGQPLIPTYLANPTIQYGGQSMFAYMPANSPWTTADVATGIFSPLQYATGACLAMDAVNFKAYFKGNEWFVSNTAIGQMLRGEVHQSRGVHITGAANYGAGFNLGISGVSGIMDTANNYNWILQRGYVSGKGANGEWKYGYAEDSALRAVSSCDMHESAFEYDTSDNITGYNGSAFAGGSSLPASAEEACEAVTANSGAWGGSALPISAGAGIALNLVDGVLVISTAASYSTNPDLEAEIED